VLDAIQNPIGGFGTIAGFVTRRMGSMLASPLVPVRSSVLEPDAEQLGRLVGQFGAHVERLLRTYRETIMDRQYQLARVADSAMELYVSSAVLNRLDATLHNPSQDAAQCDRDLKTGRYYLQAAARRIRQNFSAMWNNDDEGTTAVADQLLKTHQAK
jgi:hypothetical protein